MLTWLSFQRRCPSLVDTAVFALFEMALMLRWGWSPRVWSIGSHWSSHIVLSPHGHSIAHAAFDDATFASHFTCTSSPNFFNSLCSKCCFSQCVGFWCWSSDHEFVLVETWSSWLWGNKDVVLRTRLGGRPQRIGLPGRRIHAPRPESEKVHVGVQKGGSKSLQSVVKWKLSPVRAGDELASVRSCPDPHRMSAHLGQDII